MTFLHRLNRAQVLSGEYMFVQPEESKTGLPSSWLLPGLFWHSKWPRDQLGSPGVGPACM